jgi:hypothetical protein
MILSRYISIGSNYFSRYYLPSIDGNFPWEHSSKFQGILSVEALDYFHSRNIQLPKLRSLILFDNHRSNTFIGNNLCQIIMKIAPNLEELSFYEFILFHVDFESSKLKRITIECRDTKHENDEFIINLPPSLESLTLKLVFERGTINWGSINPGISPSM